MEALGKSHFLGVTLGPVCSLWAKIGSTAGGKKNLCLITNFCFKLSFRTTVNNTTVHPVVPHVRIELLPTCLHETTTKFGYLFLNQFSTYRTYQKDLVPKPSKGVILETS